MLNLAAVETAVVLAGERPAGLAEDLLRRLAAAKPRPCFVAADGGALHLASLGLEPDLIVGDDDSCPARLFPGVPRRVYPCAKDFTDGEAAFEYALARGPGRIAVFAALGGRRMDHFLANLLLPLRWPQQVERFWLCGADCEAMYSRGEAIVEGRPGDIVSILPLTPELSGVSLAGLVYPLANETLTAGSSRGLCNVLDKPRAVIRHGGGVALIVHYPQG